MNNEFMEFEIIANPTYNFVKIDSGPSILSNTYTNGKGIVKCSEPIKNFTYFNGGEDANNLLSLILPYGVQKVCDNCIYYMNLTELILPDTITGIDLNMGTNLKKLVLPKRLKTIQSGQIESYCGLEEVVLPEYLQKYYDIVHNPILNEPTLKKIFIPENVTEYNPYTGETVNSVNKLESIVVSKYNNTYDSRDNCNALIVTATNKLIMACHNTIIPSTVTCINMIAFYNVYKPTLTIPENVVSIVYDNWGGTFGFFNRLVIPNSVESISGNYSFNGVKNLIYNGSLTNSNNWGAACLNGYEEDGLVYTDSTKTTLAAAFHYIYDDIVLPNSVININENAFANSHIYNLTIPDTVESIGKRAFSSVKNLIYNGSLEPQSGEWNNDNWGASVLNGYEENGFIYENENKQTLISVKPYISGNVALPETVSTVYWEAFENCQNITSLDLRYLQDILFNLSHMPNLKSIILNNINIIYDESKMGISHIDSVTLLNPSPASQSLEYKFWGFKYDCLIYVPSSSVETYKQKLPYRKNYVFPIPE